jgi:LTXXQ motif family protein
MKSTRWGIVGIVMALITGVMGAAAQDRPAAPAPAPIMPILGIMGMADHVEGRIAFLKAELKITDAQLSQWNTFADALRGNARQTAEMLATAGQATALNAPDRLDRREKMLTSMLAMVRSTKAALSPLYSVLSNEQKKQADSLLREPMMVAP